MHHACTDSLRHTLIHHNKDSCSIQFVGMYDGVAWFNHFKNEKRFKKIYGHVQHLICTMCFMHEQGVWLACTDAQEEPRERTMEQFIRS
jgi:hypothetical protein